MRDLAVLFICRLDYGRDARHCRRATL